MKYQIWFTELILSVMSPRYLQIVFIHGVYWNINFYRQKIISKQILHPLRQTIM